MTIDAETAARPQPLPAGDVTFVFTDVVGSTRLFAALGDRFVGLLAEHNRLVSGAMAAHDGVLVRNDGDGLFYAFGDAADAVRASLGAQRALRSYDWPPDCPLEVRIGAHRGAAWPTGRDYIALPVHVAARVVDTSHGGQVIVSGAVAEVAQQALGDLTFSDLGLFQLRDVGEPVRLWQVDDEPHRSFPPPRATPVAGHNIPAPRTALVGRVAEGSRLAALLGQHRFVTVVGPGGVGKSRLAGEVARAQVDGFSGGVWQVPLGAVSDPQLVASATAAVLGVRQDAGVNVSGALVAALRERSRTLLFFDGCEHVLDAAADVIDALLTATDVRVLATSREPLDVTGEHLLRLGPLSVDPTSDDEPPPAAQLFIARARATGSSLQWNSTNGPAIVDICRRLDGLPLAIELVAARVGPLPLRDIATGLDDRFALARRAHSRTGEPRQQTLEASVAWSYERLSDEERDLLEAVSVFATTFSVAAAGRVAAYDNPSRAADGLSRLVAKSLIETVDGGFTLLESIRDYARRQVTRHDAGAAVRRRFTDYYVDWSKARSSRDDETFEQVRRELPNLREALTAAVDLGDLAGAAEILHALNLYWARAGYAPDSKALVAQLFDASDQLPPRALAIVLCVGAALGLGVAVNPAARGAEAAGSTLRAITAADDAQEPWLQVLARSVVAMQLVSDEPAAARRHLDEAVAIATDASLETGVAAATTNLGVLSHTLGDYDEARTQYAAAIESARRAGMSFTTAIALANVGELEIDAGNPDAALAHLREALILADAHGFVFVAALVTGLIGELQASAHDPFAAKLLDDATTRLERLVEGDPSLRGYLKRFASVPRA
ncbi:MAG: ATP-binding protein [Actinomycetes bacterium]